MSLETLISVEKKEKLIEMIAEILEVEPEEIKDDTDLVEELDADSMMALEILASVEKEFQIKIPEEELQNFTTINNIISIIEERIKGK
ncbi:acyl carrier protein [Bacillus atrophaeus]|uniref:Acyl carrier protein n=1 Tax=Bacillus atrophaeus (strain 1942) TaxID=720555 RepID=A0ABN3Z8C1_BACA1|nr:acyl carrier protein [Bacillus atrophaeus]AMR63852.1 acyl carrier protein [Bacillus subtilis subsp. globigii]ADP31143.1 acyl carrier protein [Bacillus atrophaeus 1942]AIK45590.1 phosphopantetheine attachment site family protein [Bacillus atrophaeus subsp. globigii]EIM09341.1 acyl carrier protein [Bacillus atrophaeus C89]KFK81196.1 phosphopantetheine attachment site family protein [Bacillus atrophaeus]